MLSSPSSSEPLHTGPAASWSKLSRADQANTVLLVALYTLQGVPLGLGFGTLPFILRAHMSYSALGTFALCTFPFSLKLLWSPLVDSRFWHVFGRRKSWIVPSQVCLAAALLFASLLVDETIESVCCHGIRI